MSRSAAMRCASAGQAFGSLRMRTCNAPHHVNPGSRGRTKPGVDAHGHFSSSSSALGAPRQRAGADLRPMLASEGA